MASNPNNTNPSRSIGGSPLGNAGMSVTAASQIPLPRAIPSLPVPTQPRRLPSPPPNRPLRKPRPPPAARRKKRKLPEKQFPDHVAALLPESSLHTQLPEFESLQRALRIYVFSTFANQSLPPGSNPDPPTWSVKIMGHSLDDWPRHHRPAPPKPNPMYPALRKVFGEEKVKFLLVSQKILQHLSSPQPIILEHKIKLTGNGAIGSACYDVLVDIPFPLQKEMLV